LKTRQERHVGLQEAVQKPFEAGQAEGRERLMVLLRHVMMRASKEDLLTMVKCIRKVRTSLIANASIAYNSTVSSKLRCNCTLVQDETIDRDAQNSLRRVALHFFHTNKTKRPTPRPTMFRDKETRQAFRWRLRIERKLSSQVTLVDFSREHAISYNELVEVSKKNILTSDWADENHKESMLNSNNAQFSRERLKNLRLDTTAACWAFERVALWPTVPVAAFLSHYHINHLSCYIQS
jgi:hypothetical protein